MFLFLNWFLSGRNGEREKHIDLVRERSWSIASHSSLDWGLNSHLDMCPDWESNLWPSGAWDRGYFLSFLKAIAGRSNKLREWNIYSLMVIKGRGDPTKAIGKVLWARSFRAGSTALCTLPSQRPSVQTSQSICCWGKVKEVNDAIENDFQDIANFVI